VTRERLLLAVLSEQDRAELARETGTDDRGLGQAISEGLRTGVDRLEKGRSAAEDVGPPKPALRRAP
jgi:hypothetical protein